MIPNISESKTRLHYMVENFNKFSGAKQAYIRRVLKSLMVKSKEKENAEIMINEWSFINKPENVREVNYLKCNLCGQPENVYQFRITNKVTGNHIWTGSVCIENFSIPVFDTEGKRIEDEKEIEVIFKSNVKEMKEQKRLELINSLLEDLNNISKEKGWDGYKPTDDNKEKGIFTLRQMKYISFLYNKAFNNFISDDYISLFKVNMRLKRNKDELKELQPYQWGQFSPMLGKYMFKPEHGFTEEVRKKAIKIMSYYKPENVEKFTKKVGS